MVRNLIWVLAFIISFLPLTVHASERILPKEVATFDFAVKFNGGYTKAQCMFMDLRTDEEKQRDAKAGKLSGPVIVFLHGHSQRPGNGFNFTTDLCIKSKSGIIVIPVCDTPYGRDPKWRGDHGKDVILIELSKYILQKNKLIPDSYRPITNFKVDIIDDNTLRPVKDDDPTPSIPVKLMAVGWSHGGILARRLASRYPDLITDLVQITPAGYENWGSNSCIRTGCLMSAFNWEGLRIGTGIFRGEGGKVFDAGWGIVKGQVGDTAGSCGSCIYGNFHPFTPFRIFHDTADCAGYLDDTAFPVPHLKNIVVLFGRSDSLFEYRNVGIKNPDNPDPNDIRGFWNTYYKTAVQSGTKLTVKVLPGNHIAPLVHRDRYVRDALTLTGQLLERQPVSTSVSDPAAKAERQAPAAKR